MSTYDQTMSSPKKNDPGETEAHSKGAGGAAKEPSGVKGDDPSTAGPGKTQVQSDSPENKEGHINPSAPEDSNATPGSTGTK